MTDDPAESRESSTDSAPARDGTPGTRDESLTLSWAGPGQQDSGAQILPRSLGPVRLIEEVGRGGMGVVYRGWDEVLQRSVAVKFLPGARPDEGDPHFDQFLSGARAQVAIRHPHIVAVHSADIIDEVPYLVMDYIDGPSLRDVCRHAGPVSPAAAAAVLVDVASAVARLHEIGIAHRDIKPANILFDREGTVFVTDFGLAALRRPSADPLGAAGTPKYMAPEAFEGRASPQTDVYALGIVLYELVAGHPPFVGDLDDLHRQHAHDPLPMDDLGDRVPAAIAGVLERATHKKDIFRYKTAEHFLRALRDSAATDDTLREGAAELRAIITQLIAQPDKPGRLEPSEERPSSSYFDRLTEIADQKRNESPASGPPATEPSPERESTRIEQDAPHAERTVTGDLPCNFCGYNLRSLARHQLCPECGHPIKRSMAGDRLAAADTAWLARICRGQFLIWTAGVVGICTFITFFAGFVLMGVLPPLVNTILLAVAAPGGLLVSTFLAWVGVIRVTTIDPRLALTESAGRRLVVRRFVRGVCLALLAVAVLKAFSREFASVPHLDTIVEVVFAATFLSVVVGVAFHVAGLVERVPDAKLAERTRTTARRFSICFALSFIGLKLVPAGSVLLATSKFAQFVQIACNLLAGASLIYGAHLARLAELHLRAFRRCLAEARRSALDVVPSDPPDSRPNSARTGDATARCSVDDPPPHA
ncbi:MAG TPA: serine/threonine-protein kinase [Phycisphaerae bacterium]|nr:serine/threonine-protein kinase [Phycisphaerae bacterium]